MGPRFKVSSERLEKPGIEPTTPGVILTVLGVGVFVFYCWLFICKL